MAEYVTVYVPAELREQLAARAKNERKSPSAVRLIWIMMMTGRLTSANAANLPAH
jgi:hypothetical protein